MRLSATGDTSYSVKEKGQWPCFMGILMSLKVFYYESPLLGLIPKSFQTIKYPIG